MFSVDPLLGGWCLLQNGSAIDTYRVTNANAQLFMSTASQLDLATFYSEPAIQQSKIDLQANSKYVDYLDAFHCEADSISGVFICYNYQPDYTDIGESDGYPRFSKDDPVLAAFIDSTQSEANFWP